MAFADLYNLESFNTHEEAIETQSIVESNIFDILNDTSYRTSRIIHDDPEVWRVWWQYWEVRVALHKIFPCLDGECFFHPHPWPSTIRCLKWWYDHRIWIYNW